MLLGVFVLSKGKIVVPAPTPIVDTPALVAPVPTAPQPLQNSTISSLFSALGSTPQAMPPGVGAGMSAMPIVAGLQQMSHQMQTPGLAYPYPQAPPLAPPAIAPPSVSALDALSSSIKNMTPEQINLILKGLSMANAAAPNPPSMAVPPQAPWPGAPPPSAMYSGAPMPPNYASYVSPSRSPQYVVQSLAIHFRLTFLVARQGLQTDEMITTLAIGKEGLHRLSEVGMVGHGIVTRLGNEVVVVVTVTDVEEGHLPSRRIPTVDGIESVPQRRVGTDKANDSP
jgi:hypothetical protein